jgi:hypothetical protein
MGLIACHYRAAEWRHKEIELAAHELLRYLDRKERATGLGLGSFDRGVEETAAALLLAGKRADPN